MRKLLLSLVLLCSCATANTVETKIKADLSACANVAHDAIDKAMPLVADYAICLAFNRNDASQCKAEEQSLTSQAEDSAVACGLAMIQQAQEQAHADAGSGD